MAAIDQVDVIRQGTALVVEAGGARTLVRRKDLADVLGSAGVDARRFATAAVTATGDLQVSYTDGDTEVIAAAAVLDHDDADIDLLIENIGLALTCVGGEADPLGFIPDAVVACSNGRIAWLGPRDQYSPGALSLAGARRIDAAGRMLSPGLVDCHSHPLFAGDRGNEFALRAAGADYLKIAAAGGGINATVQPTRGASLDEHIALTAARMDRALAAGTTTSEAKSGYDLTADGELRLLQVALAVDALHPVDLQPTLLGAHIIPAEYKDDRGGYVDLVVRHMIPAAAERRLATAVDVYCDQGAFTLAETRRILEAGSAAGLDLRAHVGQFADLGAAELVAELGGLSVDHVENISPAAIAAVAANDVVAVMLPGACVQLRLDTPPVEALRAAGVRMAVATDLNPGTSHCETLPIQMWLATTHYGMTVEEAWLGVTRHAARAMGRNDIGMLMTGARAHFVLWDASHPGDIPYHYGANLVHQVLRGSGSPRE